ncbi:MAG: alpha/beta hydrolase [Candidatus Lokiarchaeota archaeon]|nr:alpha/beta hydrolase [Candidatus Lokiarchaeota archaeon]
MVYTESENFSPEMKAHFQGVVKFLERRIIRSDVKENFIRNNLTMIQNLEAYIKETGRDNIKRNLNIDPYEAYIKQDPKFMREYSYFIIKTTKLPFPDDVHTEIIHIGKVPARWIIVPEAKDNHKHVLLHLHGGGYVGGSIKMPGNVLLPYRVANASKIPVLMLNYGLAPKRPYPIGLNDSVNAYKWLISEGYKPENIIIWGGSAGGGLTMATLLKLRELGITLPRAAIGLSPWVDLAFEGESYNTRKKKDVALTKEGLAQGVEMYIGASGTDPHDPYVSPFYADLQDLPPLLIEVGDWEVFLSEDTQFAQRAKEAGVDVTLNVYPEMPHVHQNLDLTIPEVQQSIDRIGTFIRKHFELIQ